MELQKIQEIAIENQRNLSKFDEWAESIDKRVTALETASNLLVQVQISLKEFTMSSNFFREKLDDMKKSLADISNENKKQHEELNNRVKLLENQPAEKWNKFVWLAFSAIAGAGITYVLTQIF